DGGGPAGGGERIGELVDQLEQGQDVNPRPLPILLEGVGIVPVGGDQQGSQFSRLIKESFKGLAPASDRPPSETRFLARGENAVECADDLKDLLRAYRGSARGGGFGLRRRGEQRECELRSVFTVLVGVVITGWRLRSDFRCGRTPV